MTVDSVRGSRDAVRHTLAALRAHILAPELHPDPLGLLVDTEDADAFIGSAEAVFAGLAHFTALASRPVVLHVEVGDDYSPIAALRTARFPFLQSFDVHDVQDTAVAAHLLAQRLGKPVVHFYTPREDTGSLNWSVERINAAEEQFEASEGNAVDALQAVGLTPFEFAGPSNARNAVLLFGDISRVNILDAGLLLVRAFAPLDADALLKTLPASVRSLAVLEQVSHPLNGPLPQFEDVHGAQSALLSKLKIRSARIGAAAGQRVLNFAFTAAGDLDGPPSKPYFQPFDPDAFHRESVYLDVLSQVFPKLRLLNDQTVPSPEYAFGKFLALEDSRARALAEARATIAGGSGDSSLAQWTLHPRDAKLLEQVSTELQQLFGTTDWIVGSDAWAYDVGMSGVHHVLTSNKNVNMLVIESAEHASKKRDIGLYAMSLGTVYVASAAVYGGYTQLLQSMLEAAAFDGPSVVVAYLPPGDDALDVLKKTKLAIETGIWPLYRYNGDITLDSYALKQSLKEFLERDQKLTMLARAKPQLARALAGPGAALRSRQQRAAEDAYAQLLEGLSGPPLHVLYASDGGQAEALAKRLTRRAKARGLKARVCAFDDYDGDLQTELNVVFVSSTAGQGEFPQNGRQLWEFLKSNQLDLSAVNIAVFGMGDSQYWPRKQDAHFYNKPSKDLFKRLTAYGAQLLADLGQGDDQDADGWSTGYNAWEPLLWTALGVDGVDGGDEPPPLTNEDMKRDSNFLRGTIPEELKDASTGAVSAVSQQLTKFHGIYMQDDRDIRDARKAQGLEPAYSFMVRVRLPGCVATPDQWLAIDRLSDERGNGTIKITTRGTFQLHGVVKEDLKPAIRGMNAVLMDTVAACGDVNRNVVGSAAVHSANVHRQIVKTANALSEHLLPRTTAYYEIWLEGKEDSDPQGYEEAVNTRTAGPTKKKNKHLVAQSPPVLEGPDEEPLYTPLYLPRKFKINIAVPPVNDVDVYGHDVGLIAIVENNTVVGYNVLVGGGMGTTHNNKKTYPRTGSLIGFSTCDEICEVAEKIMLVQRDFGNRENRKHARLKYTVDDLTVDGFKQKVEEYLGRALKPAREHEPFKSNIDIYGWVRDEEGFNHFTTFVENGRVEDTPELQHRAGFRAVAHWMKEKKVGEFRLTANQHIIVAAIPDAFKDELHALLAKYKLDNITFSALRLSSQACVAFPTCGLAMAESERYLPKLVTKLEGALEEYGLKHDSIVLRMTGCPNGCARPWLAEVALVGKAYGAYNLMLGGAHVGSRLNKLYRSSLKEEEVLATLKPMFKAWALEREDGEHFGDFVIRKGIIAETREGKDWWDNVEPGLE